LNTVGRNVEFTLLPQHETSCDSETQTKEDLKKSQESDLESLSTVSWNCNDWYEHGNAKKSHHQID